MEIIYKSIDDLNPYAKNPRKNDHAVDAVAASIKEFGFKVPIVIDLKNEIVAGHTRYKAAKKLGMTEVPCIVANDLNDQQIKAFRLADNKVGELAEWDFSILENEIEDITDIDMSEFGFDLKAEETEVYEDDFGEEFLGKTEEEPKAKLGNVYKLGMHYLMCGDSRKREDVRKLIEKSEGINLLLTDPPYGIDIVKGKHVGGGGKTKFGKAGGGKVVKAKDYIKIKGDDTTDTARECIEIVSEITEEQIIFGGNYFTDFLKPSPCWIIWDKENTGNFADVEMAWTSFDKGSKLYRWLWNGMSRKGKQKEELKTRIHPTQKPVGLIGEILKDFSDENDTVLDPFGGSGTTLIACEQLKRICYMMEYEPYYVDLILKRWEEFTGQKAVLLNE